jgi:multidrug efflux system outer membrane protein
MPRQVNIGIVTLSLALLAGCSQVGDYQRPSSTIPDKWQKSKLPEGALKATQLDWRTFFQDARLQALITSTLNHNNDLRIALARVEETRAQYRVTSADRTPSVNASGTRTKSKIPAAFTGTDQPTTTERNEFSLTAVSFELDFWGRVANMSEAAKASFLASESASRAMRITLIAQVADLYFTALELDERLIITRAAVESRRRNRDIIQRGVQLGAAARSDLLMAESAYYSTQSELASLENDLAANEHAMQLLVGKPPGELPQGRRLHEQEVRNDLAPGIPSEVIYARPDVIAAELRLKEAHANVGAARAAFLPRLLLTAAMGFASPSLAKLFAPVSGNWAFQPAMSLPIFDNGRTAGAEGVAEARKNSAVADYERVIQQAFREIADLLSSRAALIDQRQATESMLKAYEERLHVMEVRFKSGSASLIEVLDAQRDLYFAQQSAVQIRRKQLVASSQLYKALGGGDSLKQEASDKKSG